MGIPVSDEAKRLLKLKRRKRRIWFYGGLATAAVAFYLWQPYAIDWIPRTAPSPNPPVDPGRARLFAPGTKILVVTAHPDDSEFYIGGSLLQLGKTAEIHQIVCTNGDKAYYGPFADSAENSRVRQIEAQKALEMWHGKEIEFFGLPDGRLVADEALVDRLVQEMERLRPDYVICFDNDYPPRMSHKDHRRTGEAALAAAKKCGVPKWCLLFSTIAPNFLLDITDLWDQKRELLAIHASQFHGEHLKRVENMVASLAEADGDHLGTALAEGFRVVKIR